MNLTTPEHFMSSADIHFREGLIRTERVPRKRKEREVNNR